MLGSSPARRTSTDGTVSYLRAYLELFSFKLPADRNAERFRSMTTFWTSILIQALQWS